MTTVLGWLGTALMLLTGVALALSGLGLTGGSFGLLAFIGMPLLVVGLGLISAAESIIVDGYAARAATTVATPSYHPIHNPTQGAHTP